VRHFQVKTSKAQHKQIFSDLAPIADMSEPRRHFRVVPKAVVSRCSNVRARKAELFDHLVGNGEQPWRKTEAEYSGGVEVDHELEFGRLDDR